MIRTMMSGGASDEETLELWASSLRGIKERIRPLFTQECVAASAARFLDVLLGNEPRKTGWMRAEAAGDVQVIRRLAFKLAQRQIKPAHILAWSVFRRAHQAAARRSHLKSKMQL
jgi:hypothetical protein